MANHVLYRKVLKMAPMKNLLRQNVSKHSLHRYNMYNNSLFLLFNKCNIVFRNYT